MSVDHTTADGPRLGISHVTVVPTNFEAASETAAATSSEHGTDTADERDTDSIEE